jgi:flagellar basal-body rod protein FlgB
MIQPVFSNDNYAAATKMLDAVVLRHEAIASNIANVETPGYRRLDVGKDFFSELSRELRGAQGNLRSLSPQLQVDTEAKAVRPDGNTVKLENELLEMNRNALAHEFASEVVSRSIKQLKLAITGRVV